MLIPKTTYIRDEKHRRFIASLPCVICRKTNVQAAHVRRNSNCGVGLKPCDSLTVPLCVGCHAEQHRIGELKFWKDYGGYESAKALGKRLYSVTGDREKGLKEMSKLRLR